MEQKLPQQAVKLYRTPSASAHRPLQVQLYRACRLRARARSRCAHGHLAEGASEDLPTRTTGGHPAGAKQYRAAMSLQYVVAKARITWCENDWRGRISRKRSARAGHGRAGTEAVPRQSAVLDPGLDRVAQGDVKRATPCCARRRPGPKSPECSTTWRALAKSGDKCGARKQLEQLLPPTRISQRPSSGLADPAVAMAVHLHACLAARPLALLAGAACMLALRHYPLGHVWPACFCRLLPAYFLLLCWLPLLAVLRAALLPVLDLAPWQAGSPRRKSTCCCCDRAAAIAPWWTRHGSGAALARARAVCCVRWPAGGAAARRPAAGALDLNAWILPEPLQQLRLGKACLSMLLLPAAAARRGPAALPAMRCRACWPGWPWCRYSPCGNGPCFPACRICPATTASRRRFPPCTRVAPHWTATWP